MQGIVPSVMSVPVTQVVLHARCLRLILHSRAVHGAPEEALMRVCKASALKDQLVAVTITCPEDASGKEINKKLPGVA